MWEFTHLREITVLLGKNGSGKSLLLRALRDQDPIGCHYVAPERAGEISFNANLMQQQLDGQKRREQSVRNYIPQYREQIISRIQTYFLTRGGIESGKPVPGSKTELETFLSQLVPD